MAAAHAALLPRADGDAEALDLDGLSARFFGGQPAHRHRGRRRRGEAFTDLRIHADGFGRILVRDRGMTASQAGRVLQRLLEIETYRILALLAFPVAEELAPFLGASERELAEIATALTGAGEADEAALLERLTRLAAEVESREASNLFRFSAAAAYYDLVRRRIAGAAGGPGSRGCRPSRSSPSGASHRPSPPARRVARGRRPCPSGSRGRPSSCPPASRSRGSGRTRRCWNP